MTTGTIIVFLWAINLLGLIIEAAIRKDNVDSMLFLVISILTLLEFGAIKLIDYLISIF